LGTSWPTEVSLFMSLVGWAWDELEEAQRSSESSGGVCHPI
jgi:hypothetical protein